MNAVSRNGVLSCLLTVLLAACSQARDEKPGKGFSGIAHASAGAFVTSADGTVRRLDGETLPVAVRTDRMMTGLTVSEDGQQVAAVGEGVMARSSDGGKTFRVEPTPEGATVYAAAFSGGDLLLFDVTGRGFRIGKNGKVKRLELPRAARYWTASFSGPRGYVVGQGGVLIATEDGGGTWKELRSPDAEPQGVLAKGDSVWVSGREGVFRSDDAGHTFEQVYATPADRTSGCARMGGRGDAVVVACTPYEHALVHAADGSNFREVPVRDGANLLSASISPQGELWAVGANELLVRASPERGRILSHSEETRRWLALMEKKRAREEAAKHAKPRPAPPKPPPAPGPEYPVREGEPRVVRGTVRDERGQPRAGVTVTIVASWAVHGEGYQQTTTDANGRYRFKPSRMDSLRMGLKAFGYAPETRMVRPSPEGELELDVELRPEVPFAGKVLAAGEPVGQGAVTLWPLPPEGADLETWRARTVRVAGASLDTGGRFRLAGVPAGEYLLEVHAAGFKPVSQRVHAPNEHLQVQVSQGASVTGRVLSAEGAPVKDATAELEPQPETKRELIQAGVAVYVRGQTSEEGRFTLSGLPDGRYTLKVSTGLGTEHVCIKRDVMVRGGEAAPEELRLGQGPTITGKVVDARGRPVEGIEVLGIAGELCSARAAHTGRDGTFILRDVDDSKRYDISLVLKNLPRGREDSIPRIQATAGANDVRLVLPESL